jgi:hypothetical protein
MCIESFTVIYGPFTVHLRSIPQVDHLRHAVAKYIVKPVSLLRLFYLGKPIKTLDPLAGYVGHYFTYVETMREGNARQAWNRHKRGDGTSTYKYKDYFTEQIAAVKQCALPPLLAIYGDIGYWILFLSRARFVIGYLQKYLVILV